MEQPQEQQECVLCGKSIEDEPKVQIIGNKEYDTQVFDSIDCALIFKRFESVYGTNNSNLFPMTQNQMT